MKTEHGLCLISWPIMATLAFVWLFRATVDDGIMESAIKAFVVIEILYAGFCMLGYIIRESAREKKPTGK